MTHIIKNENISIFQICFKRSHFHNPDPLHPLLLTPSLGNWYIIFLTAYLLNIIFLILYTSLVRVQKAFKMCST